jgi:hypothetical protein
MSDGKKAIYEEKMQRYTEMMRELQNRYRCEIIEYLLSDKVQIRSWSRTTTKDCTSRTNEGTVTITVIEE